MGETRIYFYIYKKNKKKINFFIKINNKILILESYRN